MIPRLPPIGFVLPVATALGVAVLLVPRPAPLPSPLAIAAPAKSAGAIVQLPALSDLAASSAAFAEHPLLAENRQIPTASGTDAARLDPPPDTELGLEPAVASQPPRLRVAGLMHTDGHSRILLQDMENGNEIWAATGDSIGNWTLVEITQSGAQLAHGDAQVTIQMFEETLP